MQAKYSIVEIGNENNIYTNMEESDWQDSQVLAKNKCFYKNTWKMLNPPQNTEKGKTKPNSSPANLEYHLSKYRELERKITNREEAKANKGATNSKETPF